MQAELLLGHLLQPDGDALATSKSATPPKKLKVTEKLDRVAVAKSSFLHPLFKEGSQSSREES